MFNFWSSPEQQAQPQSQDVSSESLYSSSVVTTPSSSRPTSPSRSSSHVSPGVAAGIIALLNNKSGDELQKLLSDKDSYQRFLLSLEQVKFQNNIRDELSKETVQLARENLEKEPRIVEVRTQCSIIQTTELATAKEKLNELERQKAHIMRLYSPASLLQKLQVSMEKTDEESVTLHEQLLEGELEIGVFVQKYKKVRSSYHRQALISISAKTSSLG